MLNPETVSSTHDIGDDLTHKRRSIWRDVPMEQWGDWHWQMRNRITSTEELARVVHITPREQRTIERALERFRFAVPPHCGSLIDPDDPKHIVLVPRDVSRAVKGLEGEFSSGGRSA